MKFCIGCIFVAFMLIRSVAFAAVEVSATVDRNSLNPDDTLTFTISIASSDDVRASQPTLPSLQDFDVLKEWSAQETRSMMSATPQGVKYQTVRTTRYNFILQPKREGQLRIGAAEVVIDGRTYNTKPIMIRVAEGAGVQTRPRGGRGGFPPGFPPSGIQPPPDIFGDEEEDDPFSALLRRGAPPGTESRTLPVNPNDAFFIQVEADKTEAFVGEQITVSWYLYTRGMIRDLDTLKYPSLKGFWKEDIEIATHLNFQTEIVNGLPYKKALLASFALFPIKEGAATIDPYTAKCSVIPPMDSINGALGFGRAYTFTKSSQPIKIRVKPIPADGRPADYSGAVGNFQLSAQVEDKNIVEGQPFTLKVRFEGKGNAKLIEMPPFQVPEGLELYDTQNEAKFFRTGMSFKDFSLLLIPRREGEFTLPALSTSIFDPVSQTYVTKKTEPIRIRAGRGTGVGGRADSLQLSDGQGKAGGKVDPTPRLITEFNRSWIRSSAQKEMGLIALFAAMTLALGFRARSELGWGQKKKDLVRQLKARMRRVEAKAEAGDWRGVGIEMTNAVYSVLGEISGQGGASVQLEKLLMKAPPSVRREIGEELTKKMDEFQMLSFAPEGVVGGLKDPAQLKKAVAEMEKLMEKAVALGLSSERSSGSEPGPRAS